MLHPAAGVASSSPRSVEYRNLHPKLFRLRELLAVLSAGSNEGALEEFISVESEIHDSVAAQPT